MIRRIPIRSGDALLCELAQSLSLIGGSETSIDPCLLSVSREFAFSSTTAEEFSEFYLRSEAFSKFRGEDSASLAEVAIDKFREAESAAGDSNSRLIDLWSRARVNQRVFRRARAILHDILGPFPMESFPWACRFGPGASVGLRRTDASHQKKWDRSSHITKAALPYYWAFARWSTVLPPRNLEVVDANRVTTVPKSYKTDRTIAIEPDWNCFFQLGVGACIRRRLQRHGILLREAQEINQGLAKLGSWTNSLATLDLSMASDSISVALCEALLPEDWWRVINDVRSPYGLMPDGSRVQYEKVSSMGNGCTFELETLLFYALTLAVCGNGNRDRISVYGDDIICPSEHALAVAEILAEAGFQLNPDKSFWDGPFRESCGGHYWKGVDVTPFYVKHYPTTLGDLIVMGNAMLSWVTRNTGSSVSFKKPYGLLKRMIPRSLRGPYGISGALWDEWDACCPTWNRNTQSWRQRVITREHKYYNVSEWDGSYLFKLWSTNGDLESSRLARPLTRECMSSVFCDRDMWVTLPARIA